MRDYSNASSYLSPSLSPSFSLLSQTHYQKHKDSLSLSLSLAHTHTHAHTQEAKPARQLTASPFWGRLEKGTT